MTDAEKLALLSVEARKLMDSNQNLIDVCKLLMDCINRIAKGESADPRLDACNTMRGIATIAQIALLDGKP